jgi:uncharacterized membrane protein
MDQRRPDADTPPPDPAQRNVEMIARLEQAAQAHHSRLDRLIDGITRFIGSLPSIALHLVWFSLWIYLNVAPPRWRHFDPFPFNLLGLMLAMEAIVLSSFILITQNRQQRLADRRSHLELQINMLAEQEATKILALLEAIQQRLGVGEPDPEVAALKQATEPEQLMAQIESQVERLEEEPNPD